ncbi:hypothetical protein ACQP1G_34260 [Nocardia sp. CA-107356]|uniref:hypothetical protein n=1 Tax=Nocardia sp. CA-107356 TaxID=3239972 RepID=UPI003D8E6AD9
MTEVEQLVEHCHPFGVHFRAAVCGELIPRHLELVVAVSLRLRHVSNGVRDVGQHAVRKVQAFKLGL